jgi:hypothetical protein
MEMTMKKTLIVITTASLAIGGLAGGFAIAKKPGAEVRAIGEPVSCVSIRQIRSTNVVDENTIDFKMIGGKTYRNSMPYSCPGLRFQEAFSYRTSTSQLCSVDIIRVLETRGGHLDEGAGCGLGKFQQVEKVTAAR